MSAPITQANVAQSFKDGQAHTLSLLAAAAKRGVKPHAYVSGVGHMTHPDDVIDCCPFGPGHPIHELQVAQ